MDWLLFLSSVALGAATALVLFRLYQSHPDPEVEKIAKFSLVVSAAFGFGHGWLILIKLFQ